VRFFPGTQAVPHTTCFVASRAARMGGSSLVTAFSSETPSSNRCWRRSRDSAIAVPILTRKCALCSLRDGLPTTRPHVLWRNELLKREGVKETDLQKLRSAFASFASTIKGAFMSWDSDYAGDTVVRIQRGGVENSCCFIPQST